MGSVAIVVMGTLALLVAGLMSMVAQMIVARKALEVVLWASAEGGLQQVGQWEVRAMGAFVFTKVPSAAWLHWFMPEEEFEERCVKAWTETLAKYQAAEPRECVELFGETGPW